MGVKGHHYRGIAFVDLETTGLSVHLHEPWEIALLIDDVILEWQLPVDLSFASPEALVINRYYERAKPELCQDPVEVAAQVAELTSGRVLASCGIDFDAGMLEFLLNSCGMAPAWHHNLLDVTSYAAGALGLEPPWNGKIVSDLLGLPDQKDDEKHTARADVIRYREIYTAARSYMTKRLNHAKEGAVA